MKGRGLGWILLTMTVFAPAAGAQAPGPLQQRVSVDVHAVSPRQVLEMIARAVDCTVVVDPKVAAPVTMRVSRVTARTALNAVCESVGCRWQLDGKTLRVAAEPPAGAQPGSAVEKQAKPRVSQPLPSGEPVYVIGSGVTPPVVQKEVRPQYTPAAMDAGISGQVELEFVVLRDGTVANVRVLRSLSRELDEQAVKAIRGWLFTPGQLNGKAVAVRCAAELAFTLRERKE